MFVLTNTAGASATTPAASKTTLFIDASGVPSTKSSAGTVTPLLTVPAAALAYQPLDTDLTGIAGLTYAADKSIYYTGSAWATYDLTGVGRALLAATTQVAQRTALGAAASGANTDITSISADDLVLNGVSRLTLQVAGGTTTGPRITSYPASNVSFPGNIYYDLPVTSSQMLIGLYAGSVKNLRAYATGITWISDRMIVDNPANNVRPNTTNTTSLGTSTAVWSNLYVQNAPIVGSDARLKTEPRHLKDAEFKAFSAVCRLPPVWRWLSRVHGDENCEAEGQAARKHFGPTVQAAMQVFKDHGLEAFENAPFCYEEWEAEPEQWYEWPGKEAVLDEDGNELEPAVEAGRELIQPAREAGDRYSFRKEELLCGMVSALAREIDEKYAKIEAQQAQLNDLAARVAALEAKA
jgi:hypothetical protein